jgi:hypothetical protein
LTKQHNTFLEKTFSKDIIDAGRQLYEKGVVSIAMASGNSQLTTAIVKDGKAYEIEIRFPFNFRQKAHCSCSNFSRLGTCKHIVSVLYSIMGDSNDDTSHADKKAKTAGKTSSTSGALHFGQILETISFDELKAFVKGYARNDRKFDIHFKAAFASKIDWEDNAEKFRRILNNIAPPNTFSKPKNLSQAEFRTLTTVLETFAGQINDAIALEQYRPALNQFEPSFSRVLYINGQHQQYAADVKPLLTSYHRIAYAFLQEKLPPEFRTELINLLIDFANRSYYLHNDLSVNLLSGIEPLLRKAEKQKVEKGIHDLISRRPNNQKVILMTILICYQGKFTSTVFELFKEYHIAFTEVADKLTEINQISVLASMLDYLKSKGITNKELQHRQLLVYAALKDFTRLGDEVRRLFTETGDLKYLALIKEAIPKNEYKSWSTSLEFSLLKAPVDPQVVVNFYKFDQNWPGLLLFLERQHNPELLMKHDMVLFREEKEALTEVWLSIIQQQASQLKNTGSGKHGITDRIDMIATHLRSQKMDTVRRKAHKILSTEYPDQLEVISFFT